MFVDTDEGDIAIERIILVRHRRGDEKVTLFYHDGEKQRLAHATESAWESAARFKITAMSPAAPGTYVLWSDIDDGSWRFYRANVVAWAQTYDGLFFPVTANGVNEGTQQNYPILHPDGRVDVPEVCSFETLEDWAAYDQQQHKEASRAA